MKTKEIGAFLKSLDGADFIYLDWVVTMRKNLDNLKTRGNLTNAELAKRLCVPDKKIKNYLLGDYNYTLKDICAMNNLAKQIAMEEAAKTEVISVAKGDYKYSKPLSNDSKRKSDSTN